MKHRMTMVGALFAGLVSMQGTTLAATPAEAALAAPVTCDRACLYKALDEYLAALKAHDPSRIDWLRRLDVAAVKVGSGERNNPGFLMALAGLGKPMIVSTGMYGESDVNEAVEACRKGGCDEPAPLPCVTSYPAPPSAINLPAMDRMAGMRD